MSFFNSKASKKLLSLFKEVISSEFKLEALKKDLFCFQNIDIYYFFMKLSTENCINSSQILHYFCQNSIYATE